MKYIIKVFTILFLSVISAKVQSQEYDYKPVQLLQTGGLFASYGFEKEEVKQQIIKQRNSYVLSEMMNNCKQSNWPLGISTLENRLKNKGLMIKYKARCVAEIENDKYALILLPHENTHMPSEMQPKRNIYWIIDKSNVRILENDNSNKQELNIIETKKNQQSNNLNQFSNQLNRLFNAIKTNFEGYVGNEIPNESVVFSPKKFKSNILIEGAQSAYFSMGSFQRYKYIAAFGDFKNEAEAIALYKSLSDKIQKSKFDCCSMVQKETSLSNIRNSTWLPFDLLGSMDKAFEEAYVELEIIKLLGFDKDYKSYDQWSVVIRVGNGLK